MASTTFGAVVVLLSIVAAARSEVYFNKDVKPELAEALATSNAILCEISSINCPPGKSGFKTPPAPPPPPGPIAPFAPEPAVASPPAFVLPPLPGPTLALLAPRLANLAPDLSNLGPTLRDLAQSPEFDQALAEAGVPPSQIPTDAQINARIEAGLGPTPQIATAFTQLGIKFGRKLLKE